jgi:hypothetical protein
MVTKNAEHPNICEAARKYSVSRGKHPKVETTKTELKPTYVKTAACMDSKTEWNAVLGCKFLNGRLQF